MMLFENLKSMNIDEFAEWFGENCLHDNDPCIRWFNKTYCQNCEPVIKDGQECAYCECIGKCRYFQELNNMPTNQQTIKMWLESECN